MTSVLDQVRSYKLGEIESAKRACPMRAMLEAADAAPRPRGFKAALEERLRYSDYALITEIKQRSPSKGLIREDFDVGQIARAYAEGGSTCISLLTDGPSFGGSLDHISEVQKRVPLPVLRKDFLFDPYQVVQARAAGADCVLVILAAVSGPLADELEATASGLGMDVLVEVHDEKELEAAAAMRTSLIGVNNRDLHTLRTTLATTETLAPMAPPGTLVVSESGISSPEDLLRLAKAGARAFLVGESLLRQADIARATRELLGGD